LTHAASRSVTLASRARVIPRNSRYSRLVSFLLRVIRVKVPQRPATIVVCDDFTQGRELTAAGLREQGYRVLEAASGHGALALAADRPDLIVLDINLPDIDGFEVCRRLKSNPRTAGIAIVHLTAAYPTTEARVRGLEGGADAYLTQPVHLEELVATVRAQLRIRQIEAVERRAAQLRAVVALANATAHEINNPLMIVTGHLELLGREHPDSPRIPATIEAARRIFDIVTRMMRIMRVEMVDDDQWSEMLDFGRSSESEDPAA
jgi:DNA-binding response OmpR family regulator